MERQEKINKISENPGFEKVEFDELSDEQLDELLLIDTESKSPEEKQGLFLDFFKKLAEAKNPPPPPEKLEEKQGPTGGKKGKPGDIVRPSDSVFANEAFSNPNLMSKKDIEKHNKNR